jgi:hypothetical protein
MVRNSTVAPAATAASPEVASSKKRASEEPEPRPSTVTSSYLRKPGPVTPHQPAPPVEEEMDVDASFTTPAINRAHSAAAARAAASGTFEEVLGQ